MVAGGCLNWRLIIFRSFTGVMILPGPLVRERIGVDLTGHQITGQQMKHWILTAAVLATTAAFSTGCSKDHKEMGEAKGKTSWEGSKMKLTDLPAPVQATVATAVAAHPGAKVEKVWKETEEGKTSYEVEFEAADVDHSMKIAPDGAVLEEETSVELSALPAAVKAAVMAKYPTGKMGDANMVKEGGTSAYEVEVKINKATHELKVSAEGAVLGDEVMEKKSWEKDEKDEKDEKGK